MDVFKIILSFQFLFWILFETFWAYQLIICLFAFSKTLPKKKIINKTHKFMIVIPARNEEKTIGNLIRSLKSQNYSQKHIDVFVIADNCTDNTAQVSKELGALVYERYDSLKRRKGYALEWFFNIVLEDFPNEYDAFCVFDADNIVSNDFISKMNEKLCRGEKIVQGYRDIKNPSDNFLTACYALFYWSMNRFYHFARYKIGLSPLINGTGFMVAMSVIKETNGWHTETLTEDIEFSLDVISRGYKIGWAHDAICYDEQPTSFKSSWHQRLRWSVGHIQCFGNSFIKLIKSKHFSLATLDAIIYILGMPVLLISLIITVLNIVRYLTFPYRYISPFISGTIFTFIATIISILQGIFITIAEKKSLKKVWKGIATYPIFLVSWFVINIFAFFNLKMQWKQIEHTKSLEINDLS